MSLIHNIDHLAGAPGVVSILVDAGHQQAHRGDHQDALRLALLLRDDLGVDVLGITARELTIFVQREPGRQTAAIVVETGHAVRKSLRRIETRHRHQQAPGEARGRGDAGPEGQARPQAEGGVGVRRKP